MSYVRHTKFKELFRPAASSIWWCFLPREGTGRQRRVSTGQRDDRAAHRWYLEYVRAPAAGIAKDETTLGEALKRRRGERSSAGRAAGTIRCYEVKGKALVKLLGEHTLLSAIDARAVDAYIATRLRKAARTTVYKELVTLRGALKLARRQGYNVRPVEEVMPLDFSPKYKPKERALSVEEIERLLAALAPKRAAIVAFVIATGATYPSELEQLRKGDVNMATWTVRLRGTKRTTRDRRVPVVSFARGWLAQGVAYMPFERWVSVRRDLHLACGKAGIAKCSPNDLRRSVATLMRARGIEPHIIGCYLGHADGRMAERVYGRLSPEQLGHLLEERLCTTSAVVSTN